VETYGCLLPSEEEDDVVNVTSEETVAKYTPSPSRMSTPKATLGSSYICC
jgi:hypothetical protein